MRTHLCWISGYVTASLPTLAPLRVLPQVNCTATQIPVYLCGGEDFGPCDASYLNPHNRNDD